MSWLTYLRWRVVLGKALVICMVSRHVAPQPTPGGTGGPEFRRRALRGLRAGGDGQRRHAAADQLVGHRGGARAFGDALHQLAAQVAGGIGEARHGTNSVRTELVEVPARHRRTASTGSARTALEACETSASWIDLHRHAHRFIDGCVSESFFRKFYC